MGRIQEYIRPGAIPNITAASCTQQENNYDCGEYTMIYAEKIAHILAGEAHFIMAINPCTVNKEDTKMLRKKVCGLITTDSKAKRKNNNKDDMKQSNRKQSEETEKVVKENGQMRIEEAKEICSKDLKDPKKFPNINKDKVCFFLTKRNCKYGAKGEN